MDHTNSGRSELASIIVPCWNQLEFTRQCMAALMRCTRSPWELIVINNGSTDGTSDYLAGVQDASPVPVTVIANSTNLGFPAAVNQGLKHARGEYLVLLNNDAVVTEGWLEQLIALTTARTGEEQGFADVDGIAQEPTPPSCRTPSGRLTAPRLPLRLHAALRRRVAPRPPPLGPHVDSGRLAAPRPAPLAAPHPPHPVGTSPQGGEGGESCVLGMLHGVSAWLGR